MKKVFEKGFTMKLLNGIALGSVIVLIPGALLSELLKALLPIFAQGQTLINFMSISNTLMGFAVGISISLVFKFTPIQILSVGLAVMIGGGAVSVKEGVIVLAGTGDIINMAVTGTIAVVIIKLFGDKFKAYTMIVVPALILVVAGGLGYLLYPYVTLISKYVGIGIAQLLDIQPIIMAILLAMIFAIMIVSPISTVGIAVAISLSGVGSGAANLGICAAGFGLAIAGWKQNSVGASIATFVGSPKVQMANVIKNPKTMIPILLNAAICGAVGAIFTLEGTPMSAGFGISGLIGPINAINLAGGWTLSNVLISTFTFIVLPVVLSFVFSHLFTNVFKVVKPEDYKIELN